jgi:hypothetical protein
VLPGEHLGYAVPRRKHSCAATDLQVNHVVLLLSMALRWDIPQLDMEAIDYSVQVKRFRGGSITWHDVCDEHMWCASSSTDFC